MSPSTPSKTPTWPTPLTVPPTKPHTTTFIVLHGRGSTASTFAEPLLHHTASPSPSNPRTLETLYPTTKFIFPTARPLRAKAYNRALTHQWFDQYPLDAYPPTHKAHIQTAGLRESVDYVHDLLREAVAEVGAENVVLMGLSQGCAAAVVSALVWEGEGLGAVVGMCGWCPFAGGMGDVCAEEDEAGDDIFSREEGEEEESKLQKAVRWLREELELEIPSQAIGHASPVSQIPFFLGHGAEDEKVPLEYGRQAAGLLKDLELDMQWKEYEGLGHWYSEDMLADIVMFLRKHVPSLG